VVGRLAAWDLHDVAGRHARQRGPPRRTTSGNGRSTRARTPRTDRRRARRRSHHAAGPEAGPEAEPVQGPGRASRSFPIPGSHVVGGSFCVRSSERGPFTRSVRTGEVAAGGDPARPGDPIRSMKERRPGHMARGGGFCFRRRHALLESRAARSSIYMGDPVRSASVAVRGRRPSSRGPQPDRPRRPCRPR